MPTPLIQLSSFYSYRYFVPPGRVFDRGGGSEAEEARVRARIADGDAAFARREYYTALDRYLEAYALCHELLHPDFPSSVLTRFPRQMLALDVFAPLLSRSVRAARTSDGRTTRLVTPTAELPPRFVKLVETHTVGPRGPRPLATVAYEAAIGHLQAGALDQAQEALTVADRLNTSGDATLKADVFTAQAALRAAHGDWRGAGEAFSAARDHYGRLKMPAAQAAVDNNLGVVFTLTGDATRAGAAFQSAGDFQPVSLGRTLDQKLNPGTASSMTRPMGREGMSLVLRGSSDRWVEVSAVTTISPTNAALRVLVGDRTANVGLGADAETQLRQLAYDPRVSATDLAILDPHLEHHANLVAYLPHVYGLVLPMDIGDCYVEVGRREEAIPYYLKALDYPFLNLQIEAPRLWLKAARAIVAEADRHYRQNDAATARTWYERVLGSNDVVPVGSQLYQHARFAPMAAVVGGVVSAMNVGTAFLGNHEVGALVAYVRARLAQITAGLNWLGLAPDVVPIWSFDFLQATARYFAQHAVQAWREYISFRAAAEEAEMNERELEQAVTMSWYALQAQRAQEDLAARQLEVAQAVRDGAVLHRDNLVSARDQFNVDGWVVAELNRFQAWYGNANATTEFESGHWDWGGGRELSIGEVTAQEAIDAVIDYRNRLSHGMQIDNFNRQIAEANNEIVVANRQRDVAVAQQTVARWQSWAADQQYQFAQSNLEFFRDREFTPDLWHALADRLREVARRYLDMGIYSAFLMERAYAVENDRDLRRIRFDYTSPATGELTAGDSLLADIDSFTHDLLAHVRGRRNRVRHVVSLADFVPQAFVGFLRTGILEFKIPLWALERAYPGTFLHRIQSVEIEIEGLQVPEGITGSLTHLGVSEWRRGDGTLQSRVTAQETAILSGFRLRRDLVLYRADPNRLNLFENSGTAGSWRLELPPGTNDVDYSTISDIRFILYFYCLHDPGLEATIRATFPASGEAAQSFSARLHAPDQFFAFGPPPDGSAAITFALDARAFPFNHRNLRISDVGIQTLRAAVSGRSEPLPNAAVTVRLGALSVAGATDANGVFATNAGAGPLAPLVNQPIGDITIEFTADADRAALQDLFLLLTYRFDYR